MAAHKVKAIGRTESGSDVTMLYETVASQVKCPVSDKTPEGEESTDKWVPLDEVLNQYADEINENTTQNSDFAKKLNDISASMEAYANEVSAHSSSINQLSKKFKHIAIVVPEGGTYSLPYASPTGGLQHCGTYIMHFFGYSASPSFGYKKVILFTVMGRAFGNIPPVTLSSAYFGSAVDADIGFSIKSDILNGGNATADFEIKNNKNIALNYYLSYVQINDNI